MSKLELLLKENPGKTLEFGIWQIKGQHLFYKRDRDIYSIMPMLGNDEMTFFMSNGLTFEVKLVNGVIKFTGMSVRGDPISVDYDDYKFIDN